MPTVIDRAETERLLADGAQLVDVLARDEFAEEHIVGAFNVPLAELRAASTTDLDVQRPVIVYCYDRE